MKNTKRIIPLMLILSLIAVCLFPAFAVGSSTVENDVTVVFDALQYYTENNDKNITEEEIVNQLGEPQKQEDWNYKTPEKEYPIHTITYENREYSFYEGVLQRITLYDEFTYTNKNDFLGMFNLSKNANTTINDTNSFYRAYNCGVHDLWIQYGDGKITLTKISYGDVFGGDDTEAGQTITAEELSAVFGTILIVLLLAMIAIIAKVSHAKKNKKRVLNELKAQGLLQEIVAKHTYGLPVAEGLFCTIQAYTDHFDFYSGNVHISLANEKIIDVCTKSETEIQQQYVSSVGGAVGGAVLFGPLGAMIGGRARKKTDTTTTYYMIITYKNAENNIAYIGFDISNCILPAHKLIDAFEKNNTKGSAHIEL